MAIQLVSAQALANIHGVKTLVYARAGLGKTVLTATCPAPVLISAESGLLSLREENLLRIFGDDPSITYNLPVIEIKTIDDLIQAEVWARTSPEAAQFQTICLDSITEIAEVVLTNAKGQVKDPRQAYGELIEKMNFTIKAFRDLKGKHVYMSAKEERNKDESGITLSGPAMPGAKLSQQICYLFDEVFHMGKAKDPASQSEYRYLRTQPDFNYEAKDRSGALAELEYPHLGHIFTKIMGNHVPQTQ